MNRTVLVRPVCAADVEHVHRLSNEPSVRDSSFRSAAIPWSEHVSWFEAALVDPALDFYVAEIGGELAGQIRFRVAGAQATVSISVDPRFRGRGVGAALYRHGLASLRKRRAVEEIVAMIKIRNAESIAFFERLGFARRSSESVGGEEALVMTSRPGNEEGGA